MIIPQMPQNLSAQIVCPSPKVWDFDLKKLRWASVVRARMQTYFSENFLRYSFLITCFALGFQVIEQLPHSVHRQFDSNMIQGIFQITGGNGITIFSDLQNIKRKLNYDRFI